MYTLKIYDDEEHVFKNTDNVIKYMIETNFEQSILLYDISSKEAYEKTKEIYKFIKEYNNGKPLDDQILPTEPYGYRGILGCLGVQVYEIGLGTYKRNHECIVMFGSYNENVLDTSRETANIRPGLKALMSLAMIHGLI